MIARKTTMHLNYMRGRPQFKHSCDFRCQRDGLSTLGARSCYDTLHIMLQQGKIWLSQHLNSIYIVTICKQPQRLAIWALERCPIRWPKRSHGDQFGDGSISTVTNLMTGTPKRWTIWWLRHSNDTQIGWCDFRQTCFFRCRSTMASMLKFSRSISWILFLQS